MIRRITPQDRDLYISMTNSFYSSEAVCHPIPESNIQAAFDEMLRSDVYMEGYIFEYDNKPVGYANIAKTFSCEGGGLTVWIEELFLLPEYRSKGIGREFFAYLENKFGKALARMRLEITDSNKRAKKLYSDVGFEDLDYRQMVKEFR